MAEMPRFWINCPNFDNFCNTSVTWTWMGTSSCNIRGYVKNSHVANRHLSGTLRIMRRS